MARYWVIGLTGIAAASALVLPHLEALERPGRDAVLETSKAVEPLVEEVAKKLWDLSEVSLRETKSAAYLKDLLKREGFEITHDVAADVPTAFVAEFGSGEPRLGVLLEYDALPHLGNQVAPERKDREDGVTAGHGCGHNLIGAGAVGASLVIQRVMKEKGIEGTLRVYGAAAEESEGAKVYMARAGLFDDLDAMLHWHPMDFTHVANVRMAAATHMYIEFKGTAAHAGLYPWKGRSALDAVEVLTHSVNLMREHVEPTARIQYVIENGGQAVNVVPDRASLRLTYRDADRARVDKGIAWIQDMVKGAALCTQTEGLGVAYFGLHDTLPNTPLAKRMDEHLKAVGLPEYSDEDLAFAKALQKAYGVEETGMSTEIGPLPDEPRRGGFSDVGDVSYITPTMGITFACAPRGVALHTWAGTAAHGHAIGMKGAVHACRVLALTGVDLLTDASLLEAVKADFDKRTEGFTYESPLPEWLKEPVGIPDELRKHGSIGELRAKLLNHSHDHGMGPDGHDHDD